MAASGGPPVTVLDAGGVPFVQVSTGAPIATPVAAGGLPITLVASGAPPIVLLNDDGSAWEAPE